MPMLRLWAGTSVMSTPARRTPSGVGRLEAGGDAQRRGLPAARRAEQAHELAVA